MRLGQMKSEIADVGQNSDDVDDPIATAVDYKVAGLPHNAKSASRTAPAVAQVIGANSCGKFRSGLGARAFRIGGDFAQCLFEEGPVASGGAFAELFRAPFQNFAYVVLCRR